jgi:mono/diheme cytochrome c family protein
MNKKRQLWLGPIVLGALCLFAIAGLALRFAPTNVSASAGDAPTTFNAKCVKCHGRDGRGKTTQGRRTHARDMTDANWQNDVTDERLFNSITNGRGKMPSFKKSLNENQIDELVNYVRRLRR